MGSRNRILDPFGGLLSPQRLLNHHFGASAGRFLSGTKLQRSGLFDRTRFDTCFWSYPQSHLRQKR